MRLAQALGRDNTGGQDHGRQGESQRAGQVVAQSIRVPRADVIGEPTHQGGREGVATPSTLSEQRHRSSHPLALPP